MSVSTIGAETSGRGGGLSVVAIAAAAALAWLGLYAASLAVPPEREPLVWLTYAVYLVPIAAAAGLCALAVRRCPGGLRAFFALVALGNGAWLAGEVLWSVRELRTGAVPFPWWTDACYLGFYALLGGAFWVVYRPKLRSAGTGRLLDAALAVGSLALVWWLIVLRPLPLGADLGSAVALAGPVVALVLLGLLVATRLLPARHGTRATALVGAGLAAGLVADGVYAGLAVNHAYAAGAWVELAWQAEALLYALAGLVAAIGLDGRVDWSRFREPSRLSGALFAAGAIGAATAAAILASGAAVLAAAAVLLAVALARLVLLARGRAPAPGCDGLPGRLGPLELEDELHWLAERGRRLGRSFGLALVSTDAVVDWRRQLDDDVAALSRAAGAGGTVVGLGLGEYALLVPDPDPAGAPVLAEQARSALREAAERSGRIVRVGVALAEPEDGVELVLSRARAALG